MQLQTPLAAAERVVRCAFTPGQPQAGRRQRGPGWEVERGGGGGTGMFTTPVAQAPTAAGAQQSQRTPASACEKPTPWSIVSDVAGKGIRHSHSQGAHAAVGQNGGRGWDAEQGARRIGAAVDRRCRSTGIVQNATNCTARDGGPTVIYERIHSRHAGRAPYHSTLHKHSRRRAQCSPHAAAARSAEQRMPHSGWSVRLTGCRWRAESAAHCHCCRHARRRAASAPPSHFPAGLQG